MKPSNRPRMACGGCGYKWQPQEKEIVERCPHCNSDRVGELKLGDETPKDGVPAVKAAPAAKQAPRRVLATAKKSNTMRNLVGVVIGCGAALAGLWFAGVRLPEFGWFKADEAPKVAEKPKEEPKKAEPKKEDVTLPPPKVEKPVEPVKPPPVEKKAPAEPVVDFSKMTAYEVVKVTAGNEVVVKGPQKNITVKLIGVSCAKPGDPPIRGYKDAKESLEYTKNLLSGQRVYLYYGSTPSATSEYLRDRYGTDRAWVFRQKDEMFVNLEIVKEGYGRSDPDMAAEFLELLRYWEDRAE